MRITFILLVGQLVAASAWAQPSVHSFGELETLITPGQKIIVVPDAGKKREGEVTSITADRVSIERRQLWRHEEHTFASDAVQRVAIVDSPWDGAAIGAFIGAGLMVWGLVADNTCKCGVSFYGVLAVPLGLGIGHDIDAAINRVIFERTTNAKSVTPYPMIGPHQIGMAARLRF